MLPILARFLFPESDTVVNMEPKLRIALDLDDTVLKHSPGTAYGDNVTEELPGSAAAIAEYRRNGFEVIIHTSRSASEYEVVEAALRRHGIVVDSIIYDKPQFDVFVDNKAMHFPGAWDYGFKNAVCDAAVKNRKIDRKRYPEFFA